MKTVVNIEKVKQRIAELAGPYKWLKSDYAYAINAMMPAWTHYYDELHKKAEVIEKFYSMILERFDRIEKFTCFKDDNYYMEVPATPENEMILVSVNDKGIPAEIIDQDGKEVVKFINGDLCGLDGMVYYYTHINIINKKPQTTYAPNIPQLIANLRQSVRVQQTSGTPVIDETFEFYSPINREYSAVPTMDRLSDNTRSTIQVVTNADGSGWFEWDIEELELTESGMLCFEGNVLTDYDGLFELPSQLLNFLDKKGFITIDHR